MNDPLKDEELDSLAAAGWHSGATVKVLRGEEHCHRAAAEICELRELLKEAVEFAADNARLRETLKDYGRHKNRCGWAHYEGCDCGLDDVLNPPVSSSDQEKTC